MECDNRFYLYTGHRFYVQYHLLLLLSRNPPLSNFRIVSEQGRTKDLKTQNWQLYKSPERASAVSTNIWGDQPSRRSGSGFIVFGSEAWVPATSLCVWKSISCLLSLIPKICLSFSCSSSVQHQESLGLFGLIVHGTARLPVYNGGAWRCAEGCAKVRRGVQRCAEGCARWCASREGPGRQKSGSSVSGEKHTLLVSLSACPFMVMTRPGQKDTSNLMF